MSGWLRIEKTGNKIAAFFKTDNDGDLKKQENINWNG